MASRERLIALIQALNEYTDEAHPLSAKKLCAILARRGIAADRRSIYADIAALNRMGWKTESTTRGYYAANRPLNAGDARLAMLSIDCAPFLDGDTARRLKQGIAETQGAGFAAPAVIERACGEGSRLRSAVEAISEAIERKRQLSYVSRFDDTDVWPRERIEPICLVCAGGEIVLRAAVNGETTHIPVKEMLDIRIEGAAIRRP